MRAALLLVLAGCRQLLGLPDPAVIRDANVDSSADVRRDAPPDAPPAACPASYLDIGAAGTSRYRIASDRVRWLEAAAACAADSPSVGGPPYTHLVVLDDDTERASLAGARPPGAEYWIGLSDRRTAGVWLPVTNQPALYPPLTSPPWVSGSPSGTSGRDCGAINGGAPADGALIDDYCTAISTVIEPYICECDNFANDPSRY